MLSKKSDWVNLTQLIWRNRHFRTGIILTCFTIPGIFLLLIVIFAGYQISVRYVLAFLSGFFYCMSVTIFSISFVFSYMKFLLIHRLLFKLLFLVYTIGIISSATNCAILGMFPSDYIDIPFEQICLAFTINTIIFPPICLWVASHDNIKIDLFGPKHNFFQPRSTHIVMGIFAFLVFGLLMSFCSRWSIDFILLGLTIAIIVNAFLFKAWEKKIYANCQNTIAS